ncbi:MarR family transcriptional regulator [Pontibacter sp. JH31]|uniref:MarR family transcriptional regulator n=1 Tax=Pontibacter aquaedesilientis TaxID=2766980 RepID=A0ABR7XC51_9BACT|nr:MarR family transcriptional regulator [Pontibacter aquaedesilientis]MBD1395869.1 MarR family transcriptional regulator [Pontibacter aquaedesilientis]
MEVLKLKNQICFPIYALSREITQLYGKHLSELDVTYPQYLVLLVLWEHDTQTVNQIGEKLFLDSGTLTPLLKRMEAKELLTRKRSTVDERVVEISLTEKGLRLKDKAACIPSQMFDEMNITKEEVDAIRTITNKLFAFNNKK